ncbi:MAG: purine-binding chemotaxis protein CheW [Motiliproteus sp.]|jgi:purine-binding chemotaxis protein CheW
MKANSSTAALKMRDSQVVATTVTIAPQRAVQEYLNALLEDATSVALSDDLPTDEAAVRVAPAPLPFPVEDAVEEPVTEWVKEPEDAPMTGAATEVQPSERWNQGRPPWAQQRFECLLFKVAGLTLAVPLVELGGVLEMEEQVRPLFGQPDWYLGLLPSKTAGTIKAIDTARWVMPEKCTQSASESYKYLILIGSSEWGVACHSVEDAITLEPEQVRWRGDRSRRPWLAGTVIEHMCAIIDVCALLRLLSSQIESIEPGANPRLN